MWGAGPWAQLLVDNQTAADLINGKAKSDDPMVIAALLEVGTSLELLLRLGMKPWPVAEDLAVWIPLDLNREADLLATSGKSTTNTNFNAIASDLILTAGLANCSIRVFSDAGIGSDCAGLGAIIYVRRLGDWIPAVWACRSALPCSILALEMRAVGLGLTLLEFCLRGRSQSHVLSESLFPLPQCVQIDEHTGFDLP